MQGLGNFAKNIKDMKKIIFIILLALSFYQCNIEKDYKWDSENFVYSNFKYNFTWEFPDTNLFKWEMTTGNAEHTVFKTKEVNSGTVSFVNVIHVNPLEDKDIWPMKDSLKEKMETLTKKSMDLTGEICKMKTFKTCMFCGKHAIKYVYTSYLKDDRYKDPITHTSINYLYAYRNNLYIVGVKMHNEVYDLFSDQEHIFFKYGLLPDKEDL